MMNEEEKEYMDYLIHNRMQLTNQITKHLDNIILLQKKLDIAVKALNRIREVSAYNPGQLSYVGQFATRKVKTALKEIDLIGTSVYLTKE